MRICKMLQAFLTLNIIIAALMATPAVVAQDSGKPIIVCTTNVVGSLVREFLGDQADVIVLVEPGLCPADFDMKPSHVYAVSKAKILFKQNIPGEFWLQGLIDAAGNKDLIQVPVPGDYGTPTGAKRYISWVGGNLSKILGIDLSAKTSAMLKSVDEVSSWISKEAESLQVSTVKVVCMHWLKSFIESIGFKVVATYNPPETLSASDIANLVDKARKEGVALIVDNMQISVDFGEGVASQVGATHIVLTNFPGAIPNTENLTQMFRYNARQLFEGVRSWRYMASIKTDVEELKNQIAIFQASTSVASVVAVVLAVWLYIERRKR